MEGEDQALTLDDILDETNQVKKWLNVVTSYGFVIYFRQSIY